MIRKNYRNLFIFGGLLISTAAGLSLFLGFGFPVVFAFIVGLVVFIILYCVVNYTKEPIRTFG